MEKINLLRFMLSSSSKKQFLLNDIWGNTYNLIKAGYNQYSLYGPKGNCIAYKNNLQVIIDYLLASKLNIVA